MTPRITLAVTRRVLQQLRRDPRTVALMLFVPCLILLLLWWVFSELPGRDMVDSFGPALIAFMPFTVMFIVTSITMLRERTAGTLERMLAMPTGRADILIGYALALVAVCLVQATLVIGLGVGFLGMDVGGPLWALLLVALADSFLGTALGLAVSAFARTEFQAVQFMPALVLPQLLLCGLFIPRDTMPDLARAVSEVLPLTYAIDAMKGVQAGVDGQVATGTWTDLLVVVAIAVVVLGLGTFTLRRQTD
ncbi:ABC transporter permease [Ornithinimicrobium cavernae]|uniref:ABC transporter permease n=1 Tax=Ornithinimicrobium cavernae TaxID=2666047 RepID=UPI000D69DCD3|nr:ABC transporter permease [Ornithinimicrobium cavernae]